MGALALAGQLPALFHAEAVLFVGDYQAQGAELRGLLDQGVGAHGYVVLSGGQGGLPLRLLSGGQGAGEEADAEAQGLQDLFQGGGVLARQNLRGGHNGGLEPGFGRRVGCRRRYHGLAGAYVALEEAVHGVRLLHIRENLADGALLCAGEGEGEGLFKGGQIHFREADGGFLPLPAPEADEP